MGGFARNLGTEFKKSKGTFAWWLVAIGAGFMPLFMSLIFISRWERHVPQPGQNPWEDFAKISWAPMGLFTPFFVALLTCLFLNIEHRGNTWKHVFTLPIAKGDVYLSKLAALVVFMAAFYSLHLLLWLGCGFAVGLVRPQLQLTSHSPDYASQLGLCLHSFIASLGILAIHFWLSIRFRNMVIPIAIAVVCTVVWITMYNGRAEGITYFPYSYHFSAVNPPDWVEPAMVGVFPEREILSMAYFVVFSALGYRYFIRVFRG